MERTRSQAARATATRKARRLQILGTDHPVCAGCGYDRNPASMEVQHVAGEANQELTMVLCRTCHDDLSDAAIDTLGDLRRRLGDRDPLSKLAALLQGLADFLRLLVDSLESWSMWCREAGLCLNHQLGPRWWETIPLTVPR